MSASTQGFELNTSSRFVRVGVELLSSMRFAISLLVLICIAAVIGTVLTQQAPFGNYVNQFGPFWAEVFAKVGLYSVYSVWWFLLILAFLVTSTSLCIARNTPKIIADLRTYKENMREQSLAAFGQRASTTLAESPEMAARRLGQLLASGGWKVKLQQRQAAHGEGWMVAAKAGVGNKLGYIAAHSAIVLVCIGGLLDGDLIIKAQMWFAGKVPYQGGGMVADVPSQHRLGESNPVFRGNLVVTEGASASVAVLNQANGILLQELPFSVELKKFTVDYYSSGMPKLFASDVVIHDKETGAAIPGRVEVNHPLQYRGVVMYQSNFDDGGSALDLRAVPMRPNTTGFEIKGVVGGRTQLTRAQGGEEEPLTIEYTGLRAINVENFSNEGNGVDVRKVDLRASLDASMGAANKASSKKDLRNVGPSVSYKLRDAAGQAREYNNYMLPVDMGDGVPVYLLGARDSPAEPFRYLRIPADANSSMDDFLRLQAALADPAMRAAAVQRYVAPARSAQRAELARQLEASASSAITMFATGRSTAEAVPVAGLQAISDSIEAKVPEAERSKVGEVLIRVLNGTLYELAQLSREKAGLPPLGTDARVQAFMTQAVLALSDVTVYPAPFALQLTNFNQVQASVFQVTRAPGKMVVYLGCALLILGVFAMLYIRERRLWIWLSPSQGTDAEVTVAQMAMSTNRRTMDGDREFAHLKQRLLQLKD